MKLFIPGPTHVRPEVLAAQAEPMISHRGDAMRELLAAVLPGVREAFGTSGDVVVLSCSSTSAMEAVGRGLLSDGARALHLVAGNFAGLWSRVSRACGFHVTVHERPWGAGFDEPSAREALAAMPEPPDVVFVTHCETSTGALSDLGGVVRGVRATVPDAIVCADVTSSAAGVPIDVDRCGLDVAVGGVQKAWALPPALALAALSPRAKERIAATSGRGYADDLVTSLATQDAKGLTTSTPSVPLMRALRRQIDDIEAGGGFAVRFERHRAMAALVHEWIAARGFASLAGDGFRSPTVTSIATGGRFEVPALLAAYAEAGYFVGAGYGKTASTHWRIGHMGDHTTDDVGELLDVTDRFLERLGASA